jgi:hypothetical protein
LRDDLRSSDNTGPLFLFDRRSGDLSFVFTPAQVAHSEIDVLG